MKLKRWRHHQWIQIFDARSYDDAKKVHLRMLGYLQAGHDELRLPGKTHAWINNLVEGQWSVIVDLNADKVADMNRLLTYVIDYLRMLANIFYINPSWPQYFDQTKTLERPNPRPIALFITKNEQMAERLRLLYQNALDRDEFKRGLAKYLKAVHVNKDPDGFFILTVDLITERGIPFENEGLEELIIRLAFMVDKLLIDPKWLIVRTDKISCRAGKGSCPTGNGDTGNLN
jgi:hypothetical protein